MTTLMQAVSGALIFELLDNSHLCNHAACACADRVRGVGCLRNAPGQAGLRMARIEDVASLMDQSRGSSVQPLLCRTRRTHWTVVCGESSCFAPAQLHHCTSGHAFAFASCNLQAIGWTAAVLGVGGTVCSAYIYLVPARPAWNMIHTPLDFLLTTALLGSLLASVLQAVGGWVAGLALAAFALFSSFFRQSSDLSGSPFGGSLVSESDRASGSPQLFSAV